MLETIMALTLVLSAILAFIAHKRKWKIADFF